MWHAGWCAAVLVLLASFLCSTAHLRHAVQRRTFTHSSSSGGIGATAAATQRVQLYEDVDPEDPEEQQKVLDQAREEAREEIAKGKRKIKAKAKKQAKVAASNEVEDLKNSFPPAGGVSRGWLKKVIEEEAKAEAAKELDRLKKSKWVQNIVEKEAKDAAAKELEMDNKEKERLIEEAKAKGMEQGRKEASKQLKQELKQEMQRLDQAKEEVRQLRSMLAGHGPVPAPALPPSPALMVSPAPGPESSAAPAPSPNAPAPVPLPHAAPPPPPSPATPLLPAASPPPPLTVQAVKSVEPQPAAVSASPAPPCALGYQHCPPAVSYQPAPAPAPAAAIVSPSAPIGLAPAPASAPKLPSGPVETALVKRLRAKGGPSCRQYPQRTCPEEHKLIAPACDGGVSTLSRSSTVANWFFLYLQKHSFVLDLAAGCKGLRSALPANIRYVAAHNFVPACNYNDGLIPKLLDDIVQDMTGVVVALGVLEQVCDLPSFLEALKSYYRPLVVSYAPVDAEDVDAGARANVMTTAQWRQLLINLNLNKARHQARVYLNGVANLLYWFDPADWTPFAGDDVDGAPAAGVQGDDGSLSSPPTGPINGTQMKELLADNFNWNPPYRKSPLPKLVRGWKL